MRALLSVYDKTGLIPLAEGLSALGFDLVSSGGTSAALAKAGIAHATVESVTNAPEMLGGRVKTLHPHIHGGILADVAKESHVQDLADQGIEPFQLVVCNLYPFNADPSIEMIDVGGPTMVRAAAKNHAHVGILIDPADYGAVLDELRVEGNLSDERRRELARKAFAHTASYDASIVTWFDEGAVLPPTLHLSLELAQQLRYGENPHQLGARYRFEGARSWWDDVVQHGGKELSYLNLYDTEAAWRLVNEFEQPAVAIIKHANPCGIAIGDDVVSAYRDALACDPVSAFGGVVACNLPVPAALVEVMSQTFTEVLIAPGFAGDAMEALAKKKHLRVLTAPDPEVDQREVRSLGGGLLVHEADTINLDRASWTVPTKAAPTEKQWRDIELAWITCAYVKSNAIVLSANGAAVGIGAGQQNRLDSAAIAARKAKGRAQGGAAASDAFFPFRDGLDACAEAGVACVIQPGGSLRDDEVIAAADEHHIAMVFTGERHFRH